MYRLIGGGVEFGELLYERDYFDETDFGGTMEYRDVTAFRFTVGPTILDLRLT